MYHITLEKNINKILKEGIQPNKPQVWSRRIGAFPKGWIFTCTTYLDAIKWAFKTSWMINEKERVSGGKHTQVVIIEHNILSDDWEKDNHIDGFGSKGPWLKSKIPVSPDELITIILESKWKDDVKAMVK